MSNNAIVAKSKAIYGGFLKKEDYINLIHKGSVGAVVSYLKTKPRYRDVFIDTDETLVRRAEAEALVGKNTFDNYIRICRFAAGSKNGIMGFYIKKLEAEQLIKAIIAVNTGTQEEFFGDLPPYLMEKLSFKAEEVASAKDFQGLLSVLSKTRYYKELYPVLSVDSPDIDAAVIIVNCCYIRWAFTKINEEVKGKAKDRIKSFFLRKADLDNLLLCYRLRSSFAAASGDIKKLLIPYHRRLKVSDIDGALKDHDPVRALKKLFIEKKLGEKLMRKDDCPEIGAGALAFRFFRRSLALTDNETEALYSLMMLSETEAFNIYRIIEGVRYGLPPEEIEKYIIM